MKNKMKKLLLLLVLIIFSTSCINEDIESLKLDLENLSPFTEKIAPIKEGKTTRIYANDVLICETNIPITYFIPKGSNERIDYVPNTNDVIYGGWDVNAFTAAFEDTRNGDNDYNDFVCYITREKKKTDNLVTLDIYIQPVAYGAGTELQFGITLPNGQDTILSTNVRSDLFPNTVGFVNTTTPDGPHTFTGDTNHIKKITYTQIGNKNDLLRIHPFIINESGEKLYVALSAQNIHTEYNSIANILGYPLGIAIANGFDYPTEKTNIATVYSNYTNWILGNSSSIGNLNNNNAQKANAYKISDIIVKNPKNLYTK